MRVEVLLYDGFDDLDAIGPFEVFGHAAAEGAEVSASLRSVGDAERVRSAHGMAVVPDGPLTVPGDESDDPDADDPPAYVIVPGGGWTRRFAAGAWAEARAGTVPTAIARAHTSGSTIATVCTGSMLAVEAGIVGERPAVTHRGAMEDLRQAGATVVDARVVDDGDLVSAGGITAGIDLGLHLLEREWGTELATAVAETLEYDRTGTVHRT